MGSSYLGPALESATRPGLCSDMGAGESYVIGYRHLH